jgi:hypothetical protein
MAVMLREGRTASGPGSGGEGLRPRTSRWSGGEGTRAERSVSNLAAGSGRAK